MIYHDLSINWELGIAGNLIQNPNRQARSGPFGFAAAAFGDRNAWDAKTET